MDCEFWVVKHGRGSGDKVYSFESARFPGIPSLPFLSLLSFLTFFSKNKTYNKRHPSANKTNKTQNKYKGSYMAFQKDGKVGRLAVKNFGVETQFHVRLVPS